MEHVKGQPLNQYCIAHQLSLTQVLLLFRSVCEAVQYAHSRAIIHLDLKHSNILVTDGGAPKLLDFGIARHLENIEAPVTQTQIQFTPAFAAPEQILRQPVGTYTDVYALGVILHELLAREHPYAREGCTYSEVERIVTSGRECERPSTSADRVSGSRPAWNDLDQLCRKAMRRDAAARYRSVVELIQDIDRFLKGEPLKARSNRLRYRIHKFARRNRRALITLAVGIALVVSLVTFYTVRLTQARDSAVSEAARTRRIQHFMLNLFGGDPVPPRPTTCVLSTYWTAE